MEINSRQNLSCHRRSTVLVVDDDPDTRSLTQRILESAGFEVIVEEGSVNALNLINRHKQKLVAVILDLSMPVLDGLTLAEQIRLNESIETSNAPHLKIAFYTARNADEATLRIAAKTNVERIFCKPHDTLSLGEQVKEWLH